MNPTFTISPTSLPPSPATLQATPRCQPPAGWRQVDILPGDTLEALAMLFAIPVDELRENNCLTNDQLQPGTFIYAPARTPTLTSTVTATATPEQQGSQQTPPKKQDSTCGPQSWWVVYYVRRGDTLSRLAILTGTTVSQLQKANCLGRSTTIRVGQRLFVPHLPPVQAPTRTSTRRPPTATLTLPYSTLPPVITNTPLPTAPPIITLVPSATSQPPPTNQLIPTATALPPTGAPTNTPVTPSP